MDQRSAVSDVISPGERTTPRSERLRREGLPPDALARLVPLEGGRNFRDLGGYRTNDGRQIRWGRVFRSGAMSALTVEDRSYLDGVGIGVVCDLRSSAERAEEPNPWTAPRIVAFDYEMASTEFATSLRDAGDPSAMRATMLHGYERLPYHHLENLRLLFRELAATDRPLVFNCTAGKDRTGIASALILSALGAPLDTILADYCLSDKIVDFEALAAGAAYGVGFGAVADLPPEVRAPMLRSDPDYLSAAFSSIERQDGSVAGYLRDHVGVDEAQVTALRDRLLESG